MINASGIWFICVLDLGASDSYYSSLTFWQLHVLSCWSYFLGICVDRWFSVVEELQYWSQMSLKFNVYTLRFCLRHNSSKNPKWSFCKLWTWYMSYTDALRLECSFVMPPALMKLWLQAIESFSPIKRPTLNASWLGKKSKRVSLLVFPWYLCSLNATIVLMPKVDDESRKER